MKTCIGPCGQSKDAGEFYGKSNKCKRCTLDRQKELKAGNAAPRKKAAAGVKKKGGGRRKTTKADTPPRVPDSKWSRPGGFGFAVALQVDEEKKQTDIVLEQTTTAGEASIWLNQAEARELHSWLTEQLGV